VKIQYYDLQIRPIKLIKGKGLTNMLTKGNETALGIYGTNNLMISMMLDKLEKHEWYADKIYYFKNLTCLDSLEDYK
jgi:hypothetical protein